jgi:hypothetical protein
MYLPKHILYVQCTFCMYNAHFVCTMHILYVQCTFCMYNAHFVCTIHILYVQCTFCMYAHFECTLFVLTVFEYMSTFWW